MKTILNTTLVLAAAALAGVAEAHVTVQPATAVPGAQETLRFVVGHGCDGQPTTALRVELPRAVSHVEPQPKDGWTVAVERQPDGGVAVTWRGELAAHQADSFPVRVRLPKTPGALALPAAQTCGATTVRWDEAVPSGGPRPSHPAPSLTLADAGEAAATAPPGTERLPKGVQRLADGGLAFSRYRDRGAYVAVAAAVTVDVEVRLDRLWCATDCGQVVNPDGVRNQLEGGMIMAATHSPLGLEGAAELRLGAPS